MENLSNIAEKLANLTASEASELLDIFKEDYGIEHNSSKIKSLQKEVEVVEEVQTSFDIIIESVEKRLEAIKVLRSITGYGLKESKEIIDQLPYTLKEGISESEVQSLKSQLESGTIKVIIK